MNSSYLTVGIALIGMLAAACSGAPGDAGDTASADDENVGSKTSAMSGTNRPKAFVMYHTGGMTGVGTPACSGNETDSWGDNTRGGYQYVTCFSWLMIEWGPGWRTSDYGVCNEGVIINGANDHMSNAD